jgi:hypothetical protein
MPSAALPIGRRADPIRMTRPRIDWKNRFRRNPATPMCRGEVPLPADKRTFSKAASTQHQCSLDIATRIDQWTENAQARSVQMPNKRAAQSMASERTEPAQPVLTITAGIEAKHFTAAELLSRANLVRLEIPPDVMAAIQRRRDRLCRVSARHYAVDVRTIQHFLRRSEGDVSRSREIFTSISLKQ